MTWGDVETKRGKVLKHLDLFSGIGGFSLGLESTGHFETVAFCEIEEFPRRVLAKHWPEVMSFEDFSDYGWLSLSRPISGREKSRVEWKPEWSGVRPNWLILENEGHRWRSWLPELRRELWFRGYASLPLRVRADHMGFPHRRARVFIVAHADSVKLWEFKRWWLGTGREVAAKLAKPGDYDPGPVGEDDGLPCGMDRRKRLKALGNSVVPQIVATLGKAIWHVEENGGVDDGR